jgi:shikimate kinase
MASRSVVVLLGPPGSGKSTIGAALAGRGLRWCDWEALLLERWGSTATFVEHKAEALTAHHEELRAFIEAPGAPAVVESTGISDAAFLDGLARYAPLFVRLDVSEGEALRRIGLRAAGRHFSDDFTSNRAVWQRFYEVVAPGRDCATVINTEQVTVEDAAARVLDALG